MTKHGCLAPLLPLLLRTSRIVKTSKTITVEKKAKNFFVKSIVTIRLSGVDKSFVTRVKNFTIVAPGRHTAQLFNNTLTRPTSRLVLFYRLSIPSYLFPARAREDHNAITPSPTKNERRMTRENSRSSRNRM